MPCENYVGIIVLRTPIALEIPLSIVVIAIWVFDMSAFGWNKLKLPTRIAPAKNSILIVILKMDDQQKLRHITWTTLFWPYLVFVLFVTRARFVENKFTPKARKSRQNGFRDKIA